MKHEVDIGGNAPIMAISAFNEGPEILLGCQMTSAYSRKYFQDSANVDLLKVDELSDIHIIFEYTTDHTWGKLRTNRSNRFYLNRDDFNANLSIIDDFHLKVMDWKPDVVVASGFQLMNSNNDTKQMSKKISEIYKRQQDMYALHIEVAAIID